MLLGGGRSWGWRELGLANVSALDFAVIGSWRVLVVSVSGGGRRGIGEVGAKVLMATVARWMIVVVDGLLIVVVVGGGG